MGDQLRGVGDLRLTPLGQGIVKRGEALCQDFAGLRLVGVECGLTLFDLFGQRAAAGR